MPKFEVFIPPAESGPNLTLKVDAAHWMAALKAGLSKIGEQGAAIQNVMVDIQDDGSVHVTESQSARVFRIRELSDEEAKQAKVKPVPEPFDDRTPTPKEMPAVQAPAGPAADKAKTVMVPALKLPDLPLKPAQPAPPRGPRKPPTTWNRMLKSTPGGSRELVPETVVELEEPTRPITGRIGRPKGGHDKRAELDDLLAEVFDRVQEVHGKRDAQTAMEFLLDLALEKIPGESGSVFRSDPGTGDLTFWAVRGPKAPELTEARIVIPAGTGIVGFCATEGVAVALSDVQKDPRFYRGISEKVHYQTTSVLCCPMMTHGRSFGCFQILNKKDGGNFSEHEVGLLSYVAHQGAMYLNAR